MFNKKVNRKNSYMLNGKLKKKGYDWWWHSFTARNKETGEEKPFYIEFFIMNPAISPDKVILGQAKESKMNHLKPSYVMVNVGTWGKNKKQLHRFYPVNEVKIKKCPIDLSMKDCYLSEYETYGKVEVTNHLDGDMSDLGKIEWHLKMDKQIAWNVGYGTSKLFCDIKAFEMYWHAQGMKTLYEGSIIFDNEEYIVTKETSFDYADKNWGSNFTTPWVWLSSNHVIDNKTNKELHNTVFDIGGGKPRVFGIPLKRKLLAGYYMEGKEYEMNFSKFISHPCKTTFSFDDKDEKTVYWEVIQTDKKVKIITKISALKEDLLFINYETPMGLKPFSHLYNGGNGKGTLQIIDKKTGELISDLTLYNVGCEYGEFDN